MNDHFESDDSARLGALRLTGGTVLQLLHSLAQFRYLVGLPVDLLADFHEVRLYAIHGVLLGARRFN
jgi:hypothetical protein